VPGFVRNFLRSKTAGGLSAATADLTAITVIAAHSPGAAVVLALASLVVTTLIVIGPRLPTLIHLHQRGSVVREARPKISTIDDAVKLICALGPGPAGGDSSDSGASLAG
jgi:hypothetical protein